jgi:hypothetical protein
MWSSVPRTRPGALRLRFDSGNPAVIELSSLRPVTLRAHLSMGLPFYRMLQLRIYPLAGTRFIIESYAINTNTVWLFHRDWFRYTSKKVEGPVRTHPTPSHTPQGLMGADLAPIAASCWRVNYAASASASTSSRAGSNSATLTPNSM